MRFDLAGAAACVVLMNCTSADRPEAGRTEGCMTWQSVIGATREADPNAEMVELVEGEDAQKIFAVLNAMPPVSNLGGDHIAIVFAPKRDQFLFIAGDRDCATGIVQIPRARLQRSIGVSS
jgi:hypothetical protein